MAISEPQDSFGLWSRVKPLTEWPATDEDAVGQLATGWAGVRDSLRTTITGIEEAGRTALVAWRDGAGEDFAAKMQDTQRLQGVAARMGAVATRAGQFEQAVRDTKKTFVDTINVNAPIFGLTFLLPGQVREVVQANFAADVADSLNGVLTAKAGEIAANGIDPAGDPPLEDSLIERYQVEPDRDGMVDHPLGSMTRSEYNMMQSLNWAKRLYYFDTALAARVTGRERYPSEGQVGGHGDAFRHAYWNALLVRRFGHDFARDITTAHEGRHGNRPDEEAMDLHNNDIGRRIALENPNATGEELADYVQWAVRDGRMVVFDSTGELRASDEVEPGQTGEPNREPTEKPDEDKAPAYEAPPDPFLPPFN